ncbi:MAG: HTTM domain-containing protein [Chitinophagaceae bacterium]
MAPAWAIGIIRFQMGVVYFFAGIAKLNPDWMLHAIPMKIWLPAKTHLPLVGRYMYETWVAYLFSWFGAIYDLFIVFFLWNRRTTPYAYCFVVLFHAATALFFPGIGMFPYIMIVCSTIFFPATAHERFLSKLPFYTKEEQPTIFRYQKEKLIHKILLIYVLLQLLIPMRYLLYPGHLFWHEEGYRFSWRVMLMEKSGATFFYVQDRNGHRQEVNNAAFLTPLQEKMMSTQPDLILQYAHFLAETYRQRGVEHPEVYAQIYVALNGARSRLFIDSAVNLAAQPVSLQHYKWVLPY